MPQIFDASGFPVPDELADIWDDPTFLSMVGELKRMAKSVREMGDNLKQYQAVYSMAYPLSDLEATQEHINRAAERLTCAAIEASSGLPHLVCRSCRGRKCRKCGNRGYTVR